MTEQSDAVQRPTRTDPVAAALADRLGGPSGEHAAGHWWWTPTRVVLACFTVVFALGLVQRGPCMQTDWSDTTVRYAAMCYSDVPYLYTGRGFAEQQWPYATTDRYPPMEYPVGISYLAWTASVLTAVVVPPSSSDRRSQVTVEELWGLPGMAREIAVNFVVTALLLAGLGLAAAYFLARAHRRRPWDALPFALSPVLLLTGLINWDLLAVALLAAALWAYAPRRDVSAAQDPGIGRPVLAGALVGLGTAAKLYPLFLLGAFLVLALRAGPGRAGRLRRVGVATLAAGAAWTLAQVPAWLGDLDRWRVFWSFNADRGADLGSLWLVAQHTGATVSAATINDASWVLFGGACLAVLVIGLRSPARPRPEQLGYLVVMAFLIVNKVYSPQYVLWLLPLAVLARPRWRDLLIWQGAEIVYFGAVWLYLGGWLQASGGGASPAYDLAILVRVAGELWLAAMVLRDLWHPRHDPVAPPAPTPGAPGPGTAAPALSARAEPLRGPVS